MRYASAKVTEGRMAPNAEVINQTLFVDPAGLVG